MAGAGEIEPAHEDYDGEHGEKIGVGMPCRREVAVEQGMEHSLAAASGALVARETQEHALWHPPELLRVEHEVEGSDDGGCEGHDYQRHAAEGIRRPLPHAPPNSRSGR